MENRFHMQYCRFHVTEADKLLISGFWNRGREAANALIISLDYTPVVFEVQKQKTIKTPDAYVRLGECDERYFFWITLPGNYRDYKRLRVFERDGIELQEVFTVTTTWLEELKNSVHMTVDEITPGGHGTIIRGWCIGKESYEIQVCDRHGRKLLTETQMQRRPDVELAYPDCKREWIHGFIIQTDRIVTGKVSVTIRCDGKEKTITKICSQSLWIKGLRKAKEVGRKTQVYYQQFGIRKTLERAIEKISKKEIGNYETFRLKYFPNRKTLEEQRKEKFGYEPEFSIVVPLYRTPLPYLKDLISSIQNQTYSNWKLYLSDGSGKNSPLTDVLKEYVAKDSRIFAIENCQQLHISENTNQALKKVTGDFIVFADHDDMLAPDALYECAKVMNQFPETDIIYTDEDKVSMDGKEYYHPHFKPDFNLDLLRSANYMCHLYVVRKTLFDKIGYLNEKYNGSQDYDFILRCIEKTKHIVHIPKILYHWRMHPHSVAGDPSSKNYAYEAGKRALLEHYHRMGIDADVEFLSPGYYHTIYKWKETPLVTIIIPNKDHREDLMRCVDSIQKKSKYRNFEILIVENNSKERETWVCYDGLASKYENVRVIEYEGAFNYSAIQNFAVQRAKGEYLLLLNNDTWMKEKDSIGEMLGYCMRSDVGIVGAKLLYPDDTIQHAGVIVGLGGVAGHAFLGAHANDPGYFCRITCTQDYSAVTAACMMVKKSVFEKTGGMDTELCVAFNDTDFCLRVGEKGYRIVYQPRSVWYHDESKTRGREDNEEKIERFRQEIEYFQRRWKLFLENGDPNYNLNLALDRHDFSLRS